MCTWITHFPIIAFPCHYVYATSFINIIVIENQYQSITRRIFAINWSTNTNINRLIIDIDCYWLISIVIDYQFHQLDTPGKYVHYPHLASSPFCLTSVPMMSFVIPTATWNTRGCVWASVSKPSSTNKLYYYTLNLLSLFWLVKSIQWIFEISACDIIYLQIIQQEATI